MAAVANWAESHSAARLSLAMAPASYKDTRACRRNCTAYVKVVEYLDMMDKNDPLIYVNIVPQNRVQTAGGA
jgi:hypothetical protein